MNLSSRPYEELTEILDTGASVEIAVGDRPMLELISLAVHAQDGGGQLILKATASLDHASLRSLCAYSKGHILFKD
ncbi:MAG: hypothetical protein KIC49_11680 [Pseudomonas fluorescens]|nr:hypothetical protein [Pseudomonas fluorescens]